MSCNPLQRLLPIILIPILVMGCRVEPVTNGMEGDVEEQLARLEIDEMPLQAEAFLATDRPWRAARVMRRYGEQIREVESDRRVLAARAEAGWGSWPEVHGLLEDVPALDTYYDGIGLYLLGRARDEMGDATGAVEAYRSFLAHSPPAGELEEERHAARLRLGLALARAGETEVARTELEVSSTRVGGASMWLELLEGAALAETGNRQAVDRVVASFDSGIAGLHAWRARIEAARRAGDISAARDLANEARVWARTNDTRAEFLVAAARAALEMDDVAEARSALRAAIGRSVASPYAREAAALLLEGRMTTADRLAVARVYRAQGLHEESLEHYRAWLGSAQTGEHAGVRLEYAQALFWLKHLDDAVEALGPISTQTSPRMLLARAEAHRGNFDEAERLYLSVAEGTPGSAAQATFLAAAVRHDEGNLNRATDLYRQVVTRFPGTGPMGHAMMRLAGIAFQEGDFTEAARIWEQYLERFPRGSRILEATYWSGRAHAGMGDESTAAARFRTVRQLDRLSYYSFLASQRLDESFWPTTMPAGPDDSPAAAQQVAEWMQGIDLLRSAGFPDLASAEANRIVAEAGTDRATHYALAEALAERGYSMRAIRIGQNLQRTEPQNRRLLRILYPFPYRTLITEEARDRELDPFVTAALTRQESMFEERITSPAGARGLMQIMPSTGRGLAEAVGIDRWDDDLLYHPEINVHLGTRYVAQHMDTYDGSLPAVFSAYNAGAHRVDLWREYPEFEDEELFTERIPFHETREYVKILTLNRAIYRGLYGKE